MKMWWSLEVLKIWVKSRNNAIGIFVNAFTSLSLKDHIYLQNHKVLP